MPHLSVDTVGVEPRSEPAVRAVPYPSDAGVAQIDEGLGAVETQEFEPVLVGAESSRSAQSFAELARYDVPDGRVALLDEISINTASNGEVLISLHGTDPLSFSGGIDFAATYNGSYLYPGQRVRILHQSTDGASATNRAAITAREV